MQRSYRVRDDLANAKLTKFLLETIYLSLRGRNRLNINILYINLVFSTIFAPNSSRSSAPLIKC